MRDKVEYETYKSKKTKYGKRKKHPKYKTKKNIYNKLIDRNRHKPKKNIYHKVVKPTKDINESPSKLFIESII